MWRAAAAVLVVAAMPAMAGLAPVAADETRYGYEQVLDITFPVSGPSTFTNDYHANRGGGTRRHQATDVMAAKMQHLHAAVDGVVCRITGIEEPMPSWGYQLVICGDDGREYDYIHLNNDTPGTDDGLGGSDLAYAPGIRRGVRVSRGQWVGYVGDSGNAEDTAPHLHFSIRDPELLDERIAMSPYVQGRINPYFSLVAARQRGDVPAVPTDAPDPVPSSVPVASPSPSPSPSPAPAPEPEPVPVPTVDRVSGRTRVETAVALSAQRTSARTVIVTPSASPAESLVSAPLAGLVGAPVLLTRREGLEPSVAEEVRRLGAVNAYVVGRRDQLAEQVVTDLRAAGVQNVARLFGLDAPGLSAVVARELRSYPQVNWTDRVMLALGEADDVNRTWPDALSAGALAAHRRDPILLTGSDELSPDVAEVLADLRPSLVQIVGGTAAISEAVADQVAAAAGRGVTIERLSGRTRYETSLAVAQEAVESGLDAPAVWLATGRNFPDALAAGPAAARHRAPLLLIDGEQAGGSPTVEAWLVATQSSVRRATVVGGEAVVRGDVVTALWR